RNSSVVGSSRTTARSCSTRRARSRSSCSSRSRTSPTRRPGRGRDMRLLPGPGDDASDAGTDPRAAASSPLLEISNATVRLYKAAFGRGPTHARARFAGTDTLVVLLQDTMTVTERRLAALGEHERLRAHRLLLHKVV